jgi:hypothetical protein
MSRRLPLGLRISLMSRQELTKSKAKEYKAARKKEKGVILDRLCEDTGWSRDNARRQLKLALTRPLRKYKAKRLRASKYSARAKRVLVNVWALSGQCCGRYLHSQIANGLLGRLVAHRELKEGAYNKGAYIAFDDPVLAEIASLSPATIDRSLKAARKKREPLAKSTTKPSSYALRNEIPFGKTFGGVKGLGYLGCDTVAHCGDSLKGEHLWTLNATDISTGWSETITIKNKARRWIIEGHEEILPAFPFPIRAINYDSGSEFINYELFDWNCYHHYQMTRSRPYHKNDNAHIEQRNASIVRKHAFRFRYEGQAVQRILNALWYWVNLRKNYLVPCVKCTGHTKTRSGRTRGIYDAPKTPYHRCMESEELSDGAKRQLEKTYARLNDARVTREINRLQHKLLEHTTDSSVIELVEEAVKLAKAA